jgi:cytoskeletal protein CcmA (bactofilin family)
MAFFGNRGEEIKESNTNSATIITTCTEINGTIKGSDTIHVDGILSGEIIAENMVVIGKNGVVNGQIEAKKIIVNGTFDGTIVCDNLEVMQSGKVSNRISATRMVLDGKVEGKVVATDSIDISKNGTINTSELKSKKVTVNGLIKGKVIATELLEVGRYGSVEGEIVVKNIKTQEGGKLIGSMATYQEKEKIVTPIEEKKEKKENKESSTKHKK